MDTRDAVAQYLRSGADLMCLALDMYGQQCGRDALGAVLRAVQGGAAMRTTATVALTGTRNITFDLVMPDGEVVNLGDVALDETPAAH